MADDASFARLVSLACHDLRTPLATAYGFARTLSRLGPLDERQTRYVQMIEAASEQMTELLEELGRVARIEAGRWEPNVQEADSLQLAQEAADETMQVSGDGAVVHVDREAAVLALSGLGRAIVRHGGLESLTVEVAGPDVSFSPVPEPVGPIVLGQDLRDLGAAAGRRIVEALGGTVALDGDALIVSLPG